MLIMTNTGAIKPYITLFVFGFIQLLCEGAIITVPPVDTSICFGGITTFYCESNRTDIANIKWTFEGEAITDEEALTWGITNITNVTAATSTLNITGLPVNNGVVIGCIFVTDGFELDSLSAILTVTDIPPVENVTIGFDDTIMNITWNPPSCVPVHHLYTVSITNDTAIVRYNATELYYTISVSPCSSNYTVTVTVIDVGFTQYQSIPTSEYEEKNNTQEFTLIIDPDSLLVSFNGVESSFLTIYYEINPVPYMVCPSTIVRATANIQSVLPGPDYYNNNIVIDNLIESFDNSLSTGSYTIGPINERFIGQLNIESNITNTEIEFSTYNVQNVSIESLQNGTTNITCYFAQNSSATGCNLKFILLQSMNGINEGEFDIYKNPSKNFATKFINIPVGEYEVSVHDIVNEDIDINPSVNISMCIVPAQVITIIPSSTTSIDMPTESISSFSDEFLNTNEVNMTQSSPSDDTAVIFVVGTCLLIITLCVIIGIILVLVFLKKRSRAKTSLVVRSEIAYTSSSTAEAHVYIDVPVKQTALGIDTVTLGTETMNNEFVVEPDGGQHTSLLEPDHEDDDDFQYPGAFLQQGSISDNNNQLLPNQIQDELIIPVYPRSSNSYSVDSTAPLLPPRSSSETEYNRGVVQQHSLPEQMKEETIQEQLPNEDHESTQDSLQKQEFPEKKINPLSRNSDGHIVPSGPKLDQSHYADIEIKPKEERPRPPVSGGSTVYATFSNKDPTVPPVPPKIRSVVDTTSTDVNQLNQEQKSTTAVEETHQESVGVYFSGVSGNRGQYGPVVPSGKDEVIDSTSTVSYNHDSGEVETGTNSDSTAVIKTTTQIHESERVNSDNGRYLHCTAESCSSLKELPNYSIFAGNCDDEKQSSLTEDDSEQTDDTYISNNTDFAGSEMVLPRLRKVVVSSQPFYSHFEDVSIQKVEKENISTAKNSNGKNAKKNSEVFPKSNSDSQWYTSLWWYTIRRLNHYLPKWHSNLYSSYEVFK